MRVPPPIAQPPIRLFFRPPPSRPNGSSYSQFALNACCTPPTWPVWRISSPGLVKPKARAVGVGRHRAPRPGEAEALRVVRLAPCVAGAELNAPRHALAELELHRVV